MEIPRTDNMSTDEVKMFAKLPPDIGRKFTLDNIDIHQSTHDMTESHQNPNAHYCSLISTDNRVPGNHLANEGPISPIAELENGSMCPNKVEHQKQRQNYIQLVGRILTKYIPCLESLKDVALNHIPHQYSREMKEPTDTVSNIFRSMYSKGT